jgi:hypothetical protein
VSSFLHPTATCLQKKNPSHLHVEVMPETPFSFYKPTRSPILDTLLRKQRSLKQEEEDVKAIQETNSVGISLPHPLFLPSTNSKFMLCFLFFSLIDEE